MSKTNPTYTRPVAQVADGLGVPVRYASADEPTLQGAAWISQQWAAARASASPDGGVLVLDEVQKVPAWSETVKRLWDEDSRTGAPLKVVVLGSAPLLIARGLTESLAGRFEVLHLPHWSFPEMQEAFGFSLDDYLYFGGYPGAASLIGSPARWRRYVLDSLIETTISRDVLLLTRVDKPALLRRLFDLSCQYSGQILSYTKMLGQLQDAGNTTTLAHYLDLLTGAGMVTGLSKYSGSVVRRRGRQAGGGGHERGVEHLQLGTGAASAHDAPRVLRQPRDHAGAGEQVEVVRQGGGVACVLELAQHLGVAEDLPVVLTGQVEQPSEQRGLVDAGEQQHVAGDGGLDERVEHIATPAGRRSDERRGARVSPEVQVVVEAEAERLLHLRERPVGQVQLLEAACQALGEPARDEQRGGAEDDHLEGRAGARVFIPQSFDGLGPGRHLLHFVEHEHTAIGARTRPSSRPLLADPRGALQGRLVGAGVAHGHAQAIGDLGHQRGLADLPGAGPGLDEAPRLGQALRELAGHRPGVCRFRFAHHVE